MHKPDRIIILAFQYYAKTSTKISENMLKQKLFFGLTAILFAFVQTSMAQTWEHTYRNTQGDYLTKINAIENQTQGLDTNQLKNYRIKQYHRFRAFWDCRINQQGEATHYANALQDAVSEMHSTEQAVPSSDRTWKFIGANKSSGYQWQGMGHVRAIWVDTSDMATMLAGSNSGGLFKSTNGGRDWLPLTDDYQVLGVTGIVVNPNNKDEIFISSYLGNGTLVSECSFGIIKSLDGGQSWEPAEATQGMISESSYVKLAMHPSGIDTMFAIRNNRPGVSVFRSTDRWQTKEIVYETNEKFLEEFRFQANHPENIILYGEALLKSTDGGNNWTDISLNIGYGDTIEQIEAITHPISEKYGILIIKGASSGPAIYRTHDFFNTFELLNTSSVNSSYFGTSINGAINLQDTNKFVFGGVATGSFQIINGDSVAPLHKFNIHDDNRSMLQIIMADGEEEIYIGNDGGLISTSDLGFSIKDRSLNGMSITQHYGLSIDPDFPVIFAGTQDGNATKKTLSNWINIKCDMYKSAYSGESDKILSEWFRFKGYLYLFLNTTDHNTFGVDYNSAQTQDTLKIIGMAPISTNPLDNGSFYTGAHDLFRIPPNNLDTLWQPLSNLNHSPDSQFIKASRRLRALTICPADTNCIIMAYNMPGGWYKVPVVINGQNDTVPSTSLFRTKDYGQNWEHIRETNLIWHAITDLEFSSNDPAKVWMTTGMYWGEHVFYSQDTGRTWTEISQNLHKVPASCVTYDPIAPYNQIYVGNDLDAWFTNDTLINSKGLHQWLPMAEGMPIVPVTEIEISTGKIKRIVAATFGRGVWELDYDCLSKDITGILVNTDQTWNTPRLITGDILIMDSATLTIQNTEINFAPDVTITVDEHSKLVVDNSKLSCGCSDAFWGGIRSEGINTPQVWEKPHIVIRNNSEISNAQAAISNASQWFNSTGWETIITCSNSKFTNNRYDVVLKPYAMKPVSPNFIHFNKCSFTTNDLYFISDRQIPDHIFSIGVDDIEINGCTFANECTIPMPVYEKGDGIFLYSGTNLKIDEACIGNTTPCSNYQPTIFKNLDYGIKIFNWGANETFSIQNTNFDSNYRGIYASGSNLPTIKDNVFIVNKIDTLSEDFQYGCYLEQCTGYEFTNNVFYDQEGFNEDINTLGLILLNSGEENNLIYNNQFTNLKYGTYCQGYHHHRNNMTQGLELRCNDYTNCLYDEANVPNKDYNNNWIADDRNGIAYKQGLPDNLSNSSEDKAGNTFSDNSINGHIDLDNTQIYNTDQYRFMYFHHITGSAPNLRIKPLTHPGLLSVNIKESTRWDYFNKETSCPSDTSSGGAPIDIKIAENTSLTDSIEQSTAQLAQLVDGGDTPGLSQEAQYAQPQDSAELLTNLQASSPYLSDTVLKNTATNDLALSNERVRDIMVANPQSAKSSTILHSLENRQYPLSDQMMAEVLQGENQYSAREILEGRISRLQHRKDRLAQDIERHYMQDSLQYEALISFLQNESGIHSAYREAFLRQAHGDKAGAQTKMQEIGNSLSGSALQEHLKLNQILQIRDSIHLLELIQNDSLLLQNLEEIACTPNSTTGAYARNVLLAARKTTYNEPLYLPEKTLKSCSITDPFEKYRNIELPETENPILRLQPNPAREHININFEHCPEEKQLNIFNQKGQLMDRIIITESTHKYTLSLETYPAGIYIVQVYCNNTLVDAQQFSIIK